MSESTPENETTTHFGYQNVPVADKQKRVADVFHSVAQKYDIMNDIMSGGIHRLWKRYTIDMSGARAGHTILDLAGGTGDLTAMFSKRVGKTGKVFLADINESMLKVGRDRMIDRGLVNNIEYAQVNAESLPFANNTFDCVTIAFGLRNVTDKQKALESMFRVIKPGGRLLVLEFSKPVFPWLSKIYDQYSFSLLPKFGEWVTGDADSYQYLAESIRMHPDQETLKDMFNTAGFEDCEYHNLTGGIVALHRGFKY
ncbi:bifunctional demethylmenaquinone methyltransferase/2-methoxy-6-polyprenyl-1,4-benzoquinol methylase UbiE [Aliikangiella marina]|uniref:Ubiquinone/menaquinone biosynthesis C-methyltransferase UbiE n=1 Tax=Aliikangiella marina TaxID=1712262 RepID=A0A545TBR2_9GAMM|nr:bifunctional demethylmenaquinone methyltransferase/2-methoxy-6-polyprenyl-1,4-benzoquinol methylase UbiE [Aliikangiella marina]TQV74658.1 bifunctional demethylmenaquinone methyltransferase/2-methoxy-6-polyprenyl-1,4-benzoquinol methylase UbiE [Aliikangiella marina]